MQDDVGGHLVRVDFRPEVLEATLDQMFRTLRPERALVAYRSSPDQELRIGACRGFAPGVELSTANISIETIDHVLKKEWQGACLCSRRSSEISLVCAPIPSKLSGPIGALYAEDGRKVGLFVQMHTDWLRTLGQALGARALTETIAQDKSLPTDQRMSALEIWKSLRERGIMARKLGDLKQAESCLVRALSYCRASALGGLHLARTLNDLSEVRRLLGELEQAEGLIRECLAVTGEQEEDYGATIPFFNNLAGLLFERGQIREAEQVYLQTLERVEMSGQSRNPNAILIVSNLGILCSKMGEVERAKDFLTRAVEMAQDILGPEDPISLRCQEKLRECWAG